MNNRWGLDLISNLPVGIIEMILMFLPIRDAIRTSILSTKWRFRWVRLPQLVFHEKTMGYTRDSGWDKSQCIQNFVSNTLICHEGPIHKFKFNDMTIKNFTDIDQWLLLLSRKDIKELILGIEDCNGDYFHVPSYLYSCRNLTYLELFGCQFSSPPPTFKAFLCLRTLILRYVVAPYATIECLVANSLLLENLECTKVLFTSDGDSKLRISAPNLKCVSIESTPEEIYVCAPLLAKIFIRLEAMDDGCHLDYSDLAELQQKDSFCNYTKFLGGVPNLESLTGESGFTKYLSIGIEYGHDPLVFHHLKDIALPEVDFLNANEVLVVIRLIMGAPNLHELQVECDTFIAEHKVKARPKDLWGSECPQNFIFEKLKVIKMTRFRGLFHEMKFIKFLLESSPVLETIIVQPYTLSDKKLLKLTVELLGYCRASASAKVLFK